MICYGARRSGVHSFDKKRLCFPMSAQSSGKKRPQLAGGIELGPLGSPLGKGIGKTWQWQECSSINFEEELAPREEWHVLVSKCRRSLNCFALFVPPMEQRTLCALCNVGRSRGEDVNTAELPTILLIEDE